VRTAQEAGSPVLIVEAVERVNVARKKRMADRIIAACGGSVEGKRVALLGLAFKPNTDDMRDAPSLDIVAGLTEAGARIHAFDPEAMEQARPLMPGVHFAEDAYECATDADVLVIVTEWDAFRALDLDRIQKILKTPVMVDLRNVYRPDDMMRRGFIYLSIGRPPAVAERRSVPRP
jgi:UDPglucose 6-dehydrogenase